MEKNSLGHVIVKAWQDPKFKEKLIKDPQGTLNAEGFEIPKGVNVTVCESTDSQVFLVIPQKSSEELSEEQLLALTGGSGHYTVDPVARDARIRALTERAARGEIGGSGS